MGNFTLSKKCNEKTKGIALINDHILAVCNDDDFGVIDDGAGNYMPKYLPYFSPDQVIDYGETYFIDLNSGKVSTALNNE